MKNKEVISRRNFFKRSISATLPVLAAITIPNVLASCEIDEEDLATVPTGCNGTCTGTCSTGCSGVCSVGCSALCAASCVNTCHARCADSCAVGCTRVGR